MSTNINAATSLQPMSLGTDTGDGSFKIKVGNTGGSQIDGLSIDASGNATFLNPPKSTGVASMVRLNTANGYGSTNTKIRRFTNVVTNQGSDITYADSATLGAIFTINTSGVYAISYNDQFISASYIGVSLNTTAPTTPIINTPIAEIVCVSAASQPNQPALVCSTIYLTSGSIIRAHNDIIGTGTTVSACQFTITRVA